MANTMRWRYGDTNPVMLEVQSGDEIEIGDLLYVESATARPASSQADQSSLLLNQSTFKVSFAGVAMQASPVGSSDPIRVATTGVFEFDCESSAFEVGDLLGGAESATGDSLMDQAVGTSTAITGAIGRCAKRVNPASTRVLVDIVSTVARGGAYAA